MSYIDPFVSNKEFHKLSNIREFKGDLIIIATSSKDREYYINEIEKYFNNCTIILEKPIFSSCQQYIDHEKRVLFNKYLINLPFEPSISSILKRTTLSPPRKVKVIGSNWGLACNLLHDISIVGSFKSDLGVFNQLRYSDLKLIASKRSCFFEVVGKIEFELGDTIFEISCRENEKKSKITTIIFDDCIYEINLYEEVVTYISEIEETSWSFDVPKASITSCKFFEASLLPEASKYLNVSFSIYSKLSELLNLNDEIPFT